jgi:ATP-dependent DNA helicase RecQ
VFGLRGAAGVVVADVAGPGARRRAAAALPVLRGERQLQLRAEPPRRERRRGGKPAGDRPAAPAIELPADAAARFALLRQWRADTAREQNVPAYVIFHDATLRAIALEQPRDLVALARIGGVGVGKLERYGSELIAALEAAA